MPHGTMFQTNLFLFLEDSEAPTEDVLDTPNTQNPAVVTPEQAQNINDQHGRELLLSVLAGQNNLGRAITEQGHSLETVRQVYKARQNSQRTHTKN